MNKTGMVFIGLGFELGILSIGGLYLGDIIDKQMGWNGIGLAGTLFAVLIGWTYHLIILINKFQREEEAAKKAKDSDH